MCCGMIIMLLLQTQACRPEERHPKCMAFLPPAYVKWYVMVAPVVENWKENLRNFLIWDGKKVNGTFD